LVVLPTEDRHIGANEPEELGDDRQDAAKVSWTKGAAEAVSEPPRIDLNVWRRSRIYDALVRGEDEPGSAFSRQEDVALEVSRISAQVFVRAELEGVHEDRHNHRVGERLRAIDE
jgi:hypothetical protein